MKQPTPRFVRKYVVPAVVLVGILTALYIYQGEIRAWWNRDYTEVRVVKGSNWFDYPVGAPNAKGYYRAQKFQEGNTHHLGEDWNGIGGGNSDYGDSVYAIADGKVTFAQDAGGGWGNVVRIIHPVNSRESVDAVYAHLSSVSVREGDKIHRGEIIGAIGDAGGLYPAHLHFEIRREVGLPLGGGYGDDHSGAFCDPSAFIDKHRKKP